MYAWILCVDLKLTKQDMRMTEFVSKDSLSLGNLSVNLESTLLIMLISIAYGMLNICQFRLCRGISSISPLLQTVFGVGEATIDGA